SLVTVKGPYADAIRHAIGHAWIAPSYARASELSASTPLAIATVEGDVFRGPHLVSGGGQADSRGILETKREIKDLRERIAGDRASLARLTEEAAGFETAIAHASNAIPALHAEHHKHEKTVVAHEAQLRHASDEAARLAQKAEQLTRERRQADEERDALDRRQEEARASIGRLDEAQRMADERLTVAQRRLFEAREAAEELSRRAAEARAAHAGLVEPATALTIESQRLEEAASELEQRGTALGVELDESRRRVAELNASIAAGAAALEADIRVLDDLRRDVVAADEGVAALRTKTDELETTVKEAR